MTINEAAIDRKNNLNLIRLIASLMVVYMHAYAISIADQSKDVFYTLTNHKDLAGGIAVYIFFIISGFLICRSFDRSKSVGSYFKARFLRIWPLYFVVIMVCTFILGPMLSELSYHKYLESGALDYLRNLYFDPRFSTLPEVYNYHYNHSINGSIWTLMYEVICYMIVAVSSPIWKRRKGSGLVAAVGLGVLYAARTYFGLIDCSLFQSEFIGNFIKLGFFFAIGMCYYLYGDKIKLSLKLFLMAVVALILAILFADFIVGFGIAGSYIIFYLAFQKRFVASWYDKVGDLSYGIYIMSFPIQQTLVEKLGKPTEMFNTLSMEPLKNLGLTLLIVIPLAWFSWHLIEKQCLKLKASKNK
ncbi:MAG: acyltransferase [Pseudobutyrivibrio sp.]|nr:acyltransferase [Pseudobutyrivibrio sp.]